MKAIRKLLWSFVIGGIVMTGCSGGAPGQNDASVTEIQKEKETSEIKDVHTHDWKEADFENPKTCKECGETEGEKLYTFKERNRSLIKSEFDTDYGFATMTLSDTEEREEATGKVQITGVRIKEETEKYEKVEGYEWHIVDCFLEFDARTCPIIADKRVDFYWGCTESDYGSGMVDDVLQKNHIEGTEGDTSNKLVLQGIGEVETRSSYECFWMDEMEGVIWDIKLEYAVLVPKDTKNLIFCLYSSEYGNIGKNLESNFKEKSCILFSMDKKGGSVIWSTASVQVIGDKAWEEWFANLDDEEQQKEIDRQVGGLRWCSFQETLEGVEWYESMSREERRKEILTDYARQYGRIPEPWEDKPMPDNMEEILNEIEQELIDWDGKVEY